MIAGGEGARSWQERSRLRGPVGPSAASPIVSRGPATCPSLASRGGTQPPWPCPGSCFLGRAPSPSGDGWDRGHPCRPGPVLLGSPVCPSSRPRGGASTPCVTQAGSLTSVLQATCLYSGLGRALSPRGAAGSERWGRAGQPWGPPSTLRVPHTALCARPSPGACRAGHPRVGRGELHKPDSSHFLK